jgi:hypothetical protein
LLNLFGGGAAGRRRQAVPRLDVHRVGDVDDDLARELVGVLPDRVLDTRVVDGEDDHVAAEWRGGVKCGRGVAEFFGELLRIRGIAVGDLDLVPASDQTGADSAAHVASADDRDLHVSSLPINE